VTAAEPLSCPRCASTHALDERFCPRCGMPLVYTGRPAGPVTERQERARKVKPQYAEGGLVRVAGAGNQAEAEFVQGLLLEEGVPSTLRRTAGFDVPDFLAAGPRDVLVPASGADAAREVLLEAELLPSGSPAQRPISPARLAVGLLAGLGLIALVLWIGSQIIG
jgi:hypothetical protein